TTTATAAQPGAEACCLTTSRTAAVAMRVIDRSDGRADPRDSSLGAARALHRHANGVNRRTSPGLTCPLHDRAPRDGPEFGEVRSATPAVAALGRPIRDRMAGTLLAA